MNTKIKELLEEYEMDGEFDYDRYINASYRYVNTMQDSQVRCLLYVLAKELESIKNNNKEN